MSERFACIDCGISLPADRAADVLVQRPARRLPCVRRARRARRGRSRARACGDARRTLREGAVLAWGRRASAWRSRRSCARRRGARREPRRAVEKLPEEQRKAILFGSVSPRRRPQRGTAEEAKRGAKRRRYEGIVPRLEQRLASAADAAPSDDDDDPDAERGRRSRDDELGRFLVTRTCDACKGKRLRPEALAVKLGEQGHRAGRRDAAPARAQVRRGRSAATVTGQTVRPARARDRASRSSRPSRRASASSSTSGSTTSRSTAARRRSRRAKGSASASRRRSARRSSASSTCSTSRRVGLHARDNARLIEAQIRLRDLGNTVLVVEHDREAILARRPRRRHGPRRGRARRARSSRRGPRPRSWPTRSRSAARGSRASGSSRSRAARRRRGQGAQLRIVDARAHNLRNVDAPISRSASSRASPASPEAASRASSSTRSSPPPAPRSTRPPRRRRVRRGRGARQG